nr:hypothetical protein [Candidatus Pantoea persica]
MKLKNTILASTLLPLLVANAFAAQELTPEKAAELKPFELINVTGRFNAIGDAAEAVSERADELGAASYYTTTATATAETGASRPTSTKQTRRKPMMTTPTASSTA